MSIKSNAHLWIEVKQSYYLLAFIISVHSLALLTSLFLAVLLALKLLLLILVSYSFFYYLQRYQQGYFLVTLKYTDEFAWELVSNNTGTAIRILNSSVLTSFVIILHVEINKKYQDILVCKDAVTAEDYRQLLVALKIK